MAKTSLPLEISDQDRIILDEMINGEDEEVALRAEIVLACGDNKQNNDMAEELNVARQTISKWKEAYRRSGLAGIQTRHASGRKSKHDDSDTLQEKIRETLANHSEWTLKDIAGYLNLPDYKIQHELKRWGFSLRDSVHGSTNHMILFRSGNPDCYFCIVHMKVERSLPVPIVVIHWIQADAEASLSSQTVNYTRI